MPRARLSLDEALTIWKAHDIHLAQSFLRGLVALYVLMVVAVFCLVGYWWLGLWLLAAQYGLIRAVALAVQLVWARRPMVYDPRKGGTR